MDLQKHIKSLRKSDKKSFELIFYELHDDVYRFLVYMVKDIDVAEDLLQDVFLKLWDNRQTIKEEHSFKSFVITIANRLALNYLRHQNVVKKFYNDSTFNNISNQSPDFIMEEKELEKYFNTALNKMNFNTRTIFLLSRIENKKYTEIAEQLNISIKTVESHISKALLVIRETINIDILKKYNKK